MSGRRMNRLCWVPQRLCLWMVFTMVNLSDRYSGLLSMLLMSWSANHIFCIVRPMHISLSLAVQAVSLFSSLAAALVSHVLWLCRLTPSHCCTSSVSTWLTEEKKRDCLQSGSECEELIFVMYLFQKMSPGPSRSKALTHD